MNTIRLWPDEERPREKLLASGSQGLSDAELLAVLVRTGNRGCDAVSLCRQMLKETGGLRRLLAMEPRLLCRLPGLGPAKAASLAAVSEIAKRMMRAESRGKSFIREPECVINYLKAELRDYSREVFIVIFLDKANRVLEALTLFQGTVDQTAVHPREILKKAFEKNACALVLAHNHPSGRTEPSREDRELTRTLEKLCDGLSLKVLDHIIIGDNNYFSFRENGLMTL